MIDGTQWPVSIPPHWTRCQAQYALQPVLRDPKPNDEIVTAFRDGQVTLRRNRREEGFTNAAKEIGYQHICAGDLVVHSMDGGFGAIGVSDSHGKASPVVHAYRSETCDLHFIAYYLRSAIAAGWIAAQTKGIRERSTQFDRASLSRLEIAFPSIAEQRRIADYLDRETAEIDAMDAELDRLVETLRERKAASLDIAVTTADRSVALAWATSVIATGPFGTQARQGDYEAGGTPLINPSHIRNGSVFPDERVAVGNQKAVELRRHMMDEGDIVVARRGDLGRCAVISSSQIGFLCGTGSLRVVPNPRLLEPRYAALAISSRGSRAQMLAYSVGATMDNLNEVLFGRVQIALPPLDAQRRIVAELDEQTARIDDMIADAQRLKALLAERRSTLITEVVTGRKEVPA